MNALPNEKLETPQYTSAHHADTVRWLNDSEIRKSFGITSQVTMESHRDWLSQNSNLEILPLTVNGKYIGNIVLHHLEKHKSTYLQIYIGEATFQGRGYGEKFMQMALEYVFFRKRFHRISLHVRETNLPALKLYRKLGFKEEGLERDSILVGETFVSQIRMSLLSTDSFLKKEV